MKRRAEGLGWRRVVGPGLLMLFASACGGKTTTGGIDASTDSPTSDGASITCNGQPCALHYCIHSPTTGCPSCVLLGDAGACPAGAMLENDCPAGPAMPPQPTCVTPYTPAPPVCSDTIPGDCFMPSPANASSGDVQCSDVPCGA